MTFSDVKQSLDEKEEIISRSTSSRTSTTEYYSAISSGTFFALKFWFTTFFNLHISKQSDLLEIFLEEKFELTI